MSIAPNTPAPPKKPPSFFERHALKLSGALNLFGDIGFLRVGWQEIDKYKQQGLPWYKNAGYARAVAGAIYTVGALNLLTMGNPSEKEQSNILKHKFVEFLDQEALPVSKGRLLEDTPEHSVKRFAARNTLQLYTIGAAASLVGGAQKFWQDPKKPWMMIFSGLSLTVKSLSMAMPEAGYQPNNPEPKVDKSLFGWLKGKPLKLFGYGSFLVDTLIAADVYNDYRLEKAGLPEGERLSKDSLRIHREGAATAILYLASDGVMTFAKKDSSNANVTVDTQTQEDLEEIAVQAINMQTDEADKALIAERASDFLVHQTGSAKTRQILQNELLMRASDKSAGLWGDKVSQEPNSETTPSLA